jgi:hypothetical protein
MGGLVDYCAARMNDLRSLIVDFTTELTRIIEGQALERARTIAVGALGGDVPRGPGRPPKALLAGVGRKPRRKPPIQLCPVPGCKNRAAPVFGMVCSDHKDLSKTKIRQYREARKAKATPAAKPKKAGKAKVKPRRKAGPKRVKKTASTRTPKPAPAASPAATAS